MTRTRSACLALLIMLVLATHSLFLSGCASPGPVTTGGSPSAPTTTAESHPPSTNTVSTLPASGEYGRQLRETAEAVARLGAELEGKGAADADLTAQVYALRARSQAITAARAIVDQDTTLSDQAADQLQRLLVRAEAAASPTWASAIGEARAHAETLVAPSVDPATARKQLDAISALLAPLLPSGTATSTT